MAIRSKGTSSHEWLSRAGLHSARELQFLSLPRLPKDMAHFYWYELCAGSKWPRRQDLPCCLPHRSMCHAENVKDNTFVMPTKPWQNWQWPVASTPVYRWSSLALFWRKIKTFKKSKNLVSVLCPFEIIFHLDRRRSLSSASVSVSVPFRFFFFSGGSIRDNAKQKLISQVQSHYFQP